MRPPGPSSSVARTPGRATAALTLLTVLLTVLLTALLTGCGATIPTDPDGTLATVRGGTLRVGVSLDEPWTVLEPVDPDDPQAQDPAVRPAGTGMRPAGIEPELVTEFARTLDADVTWTLGGEQTLVAALEEGELDLVVGGLTSTSP